MEAWILHIKTEHYLSENELYPVDKYSAWMTEKQAYKAVAKFLKEASEDHWKGPFVDHYTLRETVKVLVEADYIEQAINLVNEYSAASPHKSGRVGSAKVHISIHQSTFLGSPFE